MTKPLPADPENMNDDRAQWAEAALRCFQQATGTEDEDALTDLICDLMHWSDRNAGDFEAALEHARWHYEAETTPDPDEEALMARRKHRFHPSSGRALTPRWMQRIWDFDALEIHSCVVIGNDSMDNPIVERCETGRGAFLERIRPSAHRWVGRLRGLPDRSRSHRFP